MGERKLFIAVAVLVGVLVLGGVLAFAWTGEAEARHGERPGAWEATNGLGAERSQASTVAEPARLAPIEDEPYAGELDESEIEALMMALDDEYNAWSVYDQVIAEIGAVRPFTSIQKAEENHIAALVTLFDRYGLNVPANDGLGNVPAFETLAEACAAGAQAEIDNAALYDVLFGMVDNPDIERVFSALQQASLTKHLPAFERCSY